MLIHVTAQRAFSSLALFWALTVAAPARADVTDEARELASEGVVLLEKGKAAEALAKLEAAEAKFHAPTHWLYIARAQRELGRTSDAHRSLVSILAEPIPDYAPDAFLKAQAQAKKDLVGLRPKVATMTIAIEGPRAEAATVTVDGTSIAPERLKYPLALEPGEHRVVATAGDAEAERIVTVALGQNEAVTLDLGGRGEGTSPGAAPMPGPSGDVGAEQGGDFPILGTIVLGVGVAGLAAGGITGAVTLSRAGDIKDACTDEGVCPPEQESEADSAKTLGHVSTAMFVVGGVAAAAGIVLIVVDVAGDDGGDVAKASPRLRLELAPTRLGLRGMF